MTPEIAAQEIVEQWFADQRAAYGIPDRWRAARASLESRLAAALTEARFETWQAATEAAADTVEGEGHLGLAAAIRALASPFAEPGP